MSNSEIRKILEAMENIVNEADDLLVQIEAGFAQAERNPVRRKDGNRFWLITTPGSESEVGDCVSLVDTWTIYNIALGTHSGGPTRWYEENTELYPERDRNAAMKDLYNRFKARNTPN